MRPDHANHVGHADGGKDRDVIDARERRQHLGAIGFPIERPRGALERADGVVAIHGHGQDVAERAGGLQIAHVADVEQIEAAVGENQLPAFAGQCLADGGELFGGDDLLGGHERATIRRTGEGRQVRSEQSFTIRAANSANCIDQNTTMP